MASQLTLFIPWSTPSQHEEATPEILNSMWWHTIVVLGHGQFLPSLLSTYWVLSAYFPAV